MTTLWRRTLGTGVIAAATCLGCFGQETSEAIAARNALEYNMKALSTRIEDVEASNHSLRTRLDDMRRELQQLREETRKLADNGALQEQIRRLADSIKEVDAKRRADNDKVLGELNKLARQIAETPPPPPPVIRTPPSAPTPTTSDSEPKSSKATVPEKGIEYTVKERDTLSGIVAACRARELKVTYKLMRDANPDVNWDKLRVGQKIFIPVP